MRTHEAFFSGAHCRIEIREARDPIKGPRFVATASVVDDEAGALHPLVAEDGGRIMVPAASEALALTSMTTYLESRFGGFSEILYETPDDVRRRDADPVAVERVLSHSN